ncbi:hypothetical protein HK405_003952 [Cladochytrium tenue]|nr:hypothetical protein HK405_003952 [Cladochytrium tenue]
MSAALQRAQALLRGQRNTASATAAARVVGASRPSTQSAGTPSAVAPSSRTEPSARVRKSAGTQGGDTSFSGLGTSELSDEADSDGDDDDAELDDGSDGSDDLQAYLQKLKRKGEPPSAGLGHASTKAKASPRRETDGSSYLKKGVVSSVSPEKRANSHTASSSTTYRKTNGLKSSAGELESDNSELYSALDPSAVDQT